MKILKRQIAYVKADKFILGRDEFFSLPFKPKETIRTSYCTFYDNGDLHIKRGFLWSANFPAINTENTKPASLLHDCIYNLIKDGFLPREPYREHGDRLLYDVLIECNVLQYRAFAWYKAVQLGGDEALDSPPPKMYYSPVDVKLQDNPRKGLI